jgi:hypothetical protein
MHFCSPFELSQVILAALNTPTREAFLAFLRAVSQLTAPLLVPLPP